MTAELNFYSAREDDKISLNGVEPLEQRSRHLAAILLAHRHAGRANGRLFGRSWRGQPGSARLSHLPIPFTAIVEVGGGSRCKFKYIQRPADSSNPLAIFWDLSKESSTEGHKSSQRSCCQQGQAAQRELFSFSLSFPFFARSAVTWPSIGAQSQFN